MSSGLAWFMVFNLTFNNISFISWRSVLLMEETRVPGEYHRPVDHMVVGFTTTYAISAYHHWYSKFEPRSGEVHSIQHYVIKFVSDLQQVGGILQVLWFPPSIKLTAMI
jgi:hypothetical protein